MTNAVLDLFAVANANATAVQETYESTVASMPADQSALVREFATWVEAEALISVNVRLFVIVEFLNKRCYQNTHEWASEQARISGRNSDEILRERLDAFYDRRVVFDRSFKGGEQFQYGALNAGGVGLPDYAPYCVVLSKSWQASLADAACWPGVGKLLLRTPRAGQVTVSRFSLNRTGPLIWLWFKA